MRAALVVVAFACLPAQAQAAVVSIDGHSLDYRGGPGESNNVTIDDGPDLGSVHLVTVADSGAPLAAGLGCGQVTQNEVRCVDNGLTAFDVRAGDRDDLVTAHNAGGVSARFVMRGGPGDDDLLGASGRVAELYGQKGEDRLVGGARNDFVSGGPGADIMEGRAGSDELSYSERTKPVRVDLRKRLPRNGKRGEGDSVLGFERVTGGRGNDIIYGNSAANRLIGGRGNDVLVGGGGPDLLNGGAGGDLLLGGPGMDIFVGGARTDLIAARDGRPETVRCGPGRDEVTLDKSDRPKGCEVRH